MNKTRTLSRRAFLLSSGAGAAAVATAIAVPKQGIGSRKPASDRRATQGYQDSAHINNYYRTTKV